MQRVRGLEQRTLAGLGEERRIATTSRGADDLLEHRPTHPSAKEKGARPHRFDLPCVRTQHLERATATEHPPRPTPSNR